VVDAGPDFDAGSDAGSPTDAGTDAGAVDQATFLYFFSNPE
jgi:hypothetical protein